VSERRKATSTSSFGTGRRENHDSRSFYARFMPPRLSTDDAVNPPGDLDEFFCGDARSMDKINPGSVALVVTSTPYFAGKEYEEALGEGHVPATYLDYLDMLCDVFAECAAKLEPGGRIAVNVANLGRKPFRSLAADIIGILQDRLGLLLRGEIVWVKARGATGSCAWGSWQSPANPVLRDLTERVIVASKGRFDRAFTSRQRAAAGLPSEGSIFKEEFLEGTTDVWAIPAESATRVGHPAPFPVELPQRLIELYTYRGDLILDPFMGSGSTAVAALRTERHYVGYDTSRDYVDKARKRIETEKRRLGARPARLPRRVVLPAVETRTDDPDSQSRVVREGGKATEIACAVLIDCGFTGLRADCRHPSGIEASFEAADRAGQRWLFDVSGAYMGARAGLCRSDTLWKALGRAAVLSSGAGGPRLVLLTTDLPVPGSLGDIALKSARGGVFYDALEILSGPGQDRLREYASGAAPPDPPGDLLPPA
jgi:DNA modification methylase